MANDAKLQQALANKIEVLTEKVCHCYSIYSSAQGSFIFEEKGTTTDHQYKIFF